MAVDTEDGCREEPPATARPAWPAPPVGAHGRFGSLRAYVAPQILLGEGGD